jgi:hypothetical protein
MYVGRLRLGVYSGLTVESMNYLADYMYALVRQRLWTK